MNRNMLVAVVIGIIAYTWPARAWSEETGEKKQPNPQEKVESKPRKRERLLTLIVTLPTDWNSKRQRIPNNKHEGLSIFKASEEDKHGFGIFRHPGFNARPYTAEGIAAANIEGSFIPGGLPFRTKEIKVGVEKRDGQWIGYTQNGKVTDLVFVKHEDNVFRLSGTYPKDDNEMRDLFWDMVRSAEFVSEADKK